MDEVMGAANFVSTLVWKKKQGGSNDSGYVVTDHEYILVYAKDITQVDLPGSKESGLKVVRDILKDIPGVAFINLSDGDVVRHEIVQRIVRAYEDYDRRRREEKQPAAGQL